MDVTNNTHEATSAPYPHLRAWRGGALALMTAPRSGVCLANGKVGRDVGRHYQDYPDNLGWVVHGSVTITMP